MAFKRWQIIAGIALFVVSTVASALSLGRVRGTALIGRGLDLSIQSSLETQEAIPEGNCLSVELFYGEVRVSPSTVSVMPERTSSGELRLRIRSSTAVDEPVVTLFVRSTCGASISRRYVLLAEALTEADPGSVAPITAASTPAAPVASLATPRIAFGGATIASPGAASGDSASSTAGSRRAERAAQRQAQREARQQRQALARSNPASNAVPVASSQRITPPASVVRKSVNPSAPRLKIDLVDIAAAVPSLRSSTELGGAPASDEAVRRQAQALWRTLNASPEEVLRDAQRVESLDAQLRAALEQSKRQGKDITALSTELNAAQKARYLNPFTIFLGVLTLCALGLSLFFWHRSRGSMSGQPWWGNTGVKAEPKDERHLWKHLSDGSETGMQDLQTPANSSFSANTTAPIAPASSNRSGELPRSGLMAEKDQASSQRLVEKSTDPVAFKPSAEKASSGAVKNQPLASSAPAGRGGSTGRGDSTPAPQFIQPPVTSGRVPRSGFGNTDFATSSFNPPRVVAAEELFDIQEQADFFLSLAQPEQAIEVLKNHITDNVETSALAYMDLFNIYHSTGRQADYSDLREEFNRVFNAQVPEFAQYGAQSNGLEDFPNTLGNIQAAWGKPHQAQDVIEESIFRQPDADSQTLDMTAYRELMLLYALAKELARPDAAYSMLPISMQSPVLPAFSDSNSPDVDLGDGLILSSPSDDLLAPDERTMSLPSSSLKDSDEPNADGSLDFDLSESPDFSIIKMPNAPKKS